MFDSRWMTLVVMAFLLIGGFAVPVPAAQSDPRTITRPATSGPLSVMTYNVEGLPFPAGLNRAPALERIGRRLAGLRRVGRQPHVVLLQEAFTPQAKAIAALAGYPFVVVGPRPVDLVQTAAAVMPSGYRATASWRDGETEGKWLDSGLVVMSDFPITHTARIAFAADACAGFDCLAAKGVLLAWIRVPGQAAPIAIADTHLNSRHASGAPIARADEAFAEQWDEARTFIAANVGPRTSLIFGGDFNIGHEPARIIRASEGPIPNAEEAIAKIATTNPSPWLATDLWAVAGRGKDKQFFRAGMGKRLQLRKVEVPFGIAARGCDLSDHLGFVATYSIGEPGSPVRCRQRRGGTCT